MREDCCMPNVIKTHSRRVYFQFLNPLQMKKILMTVFTVLAFSAAFYAKATETEPVDATNCTYTGNSSDYCNASDGTHNLKVQNCKPGSTDCAYDPPAAP